MSHGKIERPDKIEKYNSNLNFNIPKIFIPFTKFFENQDKKDIYSGNEKIPFNKKHPIFRALMRIEFEDAMRRYLKTISY